MLTIIGFVLVIASALGGFMIAGGKIALLLALGEYVVIIGCAIGVFVAATPTGVLRRLPADFRDKIMGDGPDRSFYLDMLRLFFELAQMARAEGVNAIETHIENPDGSPLFARYPLVLKNRSALAFLCDTMRLVVLGSLKPHEIEEIAESSIESAEQDAGQGAQALYRVADALPGLGIVAAVLGIVVTMQHLDGPVSEIGAHVASALVGTFLGVFLAYGVVGPLSSRMQLGAQREVQVLRTIKSAIRAMSDNHPPIVVVEFMRRSVPEEVRPGFEALSEATRALRDAARRPRG
jgi:chemotaxis protein MotA